MTTRTFLYFAYGSNMSVRRLRARTPSAVPLGQAHVGGYRLMFNKAGQDGSAKAACEATGDAADRVIGGLFRIDEAERPALDHAEGLGRHYNAVNIDLAGPEGPRQAMTYIAIDRQPGLLPFDWYLTHVLQGTKDFGLPADYVADISRIATQADQRPGYPDKELGIYASPWVRLEAPGDAAAIHGVTADAFAQAAHRDGTEPHIVDALRQHGALAVSLVAEVMSEWLNKGSGAPMGRIVGHLALSPVRISDGSPGWFGLGPVSVHPRHQRAGIGALLMQRGLAELRARQAAGCVLLGDPTFYARFGFSVDTRLSLPGAPAPYFLVHRLGDDSASGQVTYHPAFNPPPGA